jgi:hypothetical protein
MRTSTQKPDASASAVSKSGARLTTAELMNEKGIKAQLCVIAFLEAHLARIGSPFKGQATEISGREDRDGIDWWLVNTQEGWKLPVDFSFCYKDGASVQLQHDWFTENNDGTLRFIENKANALFRAFMVVVANPSLRVYVSRS